MAKKSCLTHLQVQFAGNYFYDTGIYLPKLAILSLYFRLFPPTMPWLRKVLHTVCFFTGSAMITTCLLDTFWCGQQVSVNWSLEEDACSTFNSKVVFRVDWVMNIITDVLSEPSDSLQLWNLETDSVKQSLCFHFQCSIEYSSIGVRFGDLLQLFLSAPSPSPSVLSALQQ